MYLTIQMLHCMSSVWAALIGELIQSQGQLEVDPDLSSNSVKSMLIPNLLKYKSLCHGSIIKAQNHSKAIYLFLALIFCSPSFSAAVRNQT